MFAKKKFGAKQFCLKFSWHQELGTHFSIDFWNNARRFYTDIKIDNKLKWLQFQTVRKSLQTNYIVGHFMNNVQKQD